MDEHLTLPELAEATGLSLEFAHEAQRWRFIQVDRGWGTDTPCINRRWSRGRCEWQIIRWRHATTPNC